MFDGISPKVMMVGVLIASLVYLLLPFDLIPDFLGIPGRVDDVAVIGFLTWLYKNHASKFSQTAGRERESSESRESSYSEGASKHSTPRFDPHEVLGIDRTASQREIQSAYRARMQEYHPDKVSHLGEGLQELAHAKTQEIQRAYKELSS